MISGAGSRGLYLVILVLSLRHRGVYFYNDHPKSTVHSVLKKNQMGT